MFGCILLWVVGCDSLFPCCTLLAGTYTGPYGPMYTSSDSELRAALGFQTISLAAGEQRVVEHPVSGAGYTVWTWHTEAHNVGLHVQFVSIEGDKGEVSPSGASSPSGAWCSWCVTSPAPLAGTLRL